VGGKWTPESGRQALEEFSQYKRAGVKVDAGSGESTVDFNPGDFAQGENTTEKANALLATTFPEEIVVAQSKHTV